MDYKILFNKLVRRYRNRGLKIIVKHSRKIKRGECEGFYYHNNKIEVIYSAIGGKPFGRMASTLLHEAGHHVNRRKYENINGKKDNFYKGSKEIEEEVSAWLYAIKNANKINKKFVMFVKNDSLECVVTYLISAGYIPNKIIKMASKDLTVEEVYKIINLIVKSGVKNKNKNKTKKGDGNGRYKINRKRSCIY